MTKRRKHLRTNSQTSRRFGKQFLITYTTAMTRNFRYTTAAITRSRHIRTHPVDVCRFPRGETVQSVINISGIFLEYVFAIWGLIFFFFFFM